MNRPRYAIYFVPEEGTSLDQFGASWVGRSCFTGRHLVPSGLTPEIETLRLKYLADPHRYGFHATLKPPFALANGLSKKQLLDALSEFARQQTLIALPPLAVRTLGNFIALVPSAEAPLIHRLAEACVCRFDEFRARPSQDELNRRRAAKLTLRQDTYLQTWGYPYVLDEFRFHMTLTGRIDSDEERGVLQEALQSLWHSMSSQPVLVDAVTLLVEEAKGDDFYVLERFSFAKR
ncbi:Phosphonate metabolism protein [Rhodospirillaceae bacterium LM-1]|nr:Phosphonate metabolism protein [Rhodospirillaceae bacterium LM-1]